jgi:hypothetical protein
MHAQKVNIFISKILPSIPDFPKWSFYIDSLNIPGIYFQQEKHTIGNPKRINILSGE